MSADLLYKLKKEIKELRDIIYDIPHLQSWRNRLQIESDFIERLLAEDKLKKYLDKIIEHKEREIAKKSINVEVN